MKSALFLFTALATVISLDLTADEHEFTTTSLNEVPVSVPSYESKTCTPKDIVAKTVKAIKGSEWTKNLNSGGLAKVTNTATDSSSIAIGKKEGTDLAAASHAKTIGSCYEPSSITKEIFTGNRNSNKGQLISAKRVEDIRECLLKQKEHRKTMQELVQSCLPKDLVDTSGVDSLFEKSANKFEGYYLGAGAVLNGDRATYQGKNGNFKTEYGASSFSFGAVLFIGHNFKINSKSFFGLELQGGTSTTNLKPFETEGSNALDTFEINLKQKWRTSFVLRYGYLVAPRTAVYAGLGLDLTSWSFDVKNRSTAQTTAEAKSDLHISKTFHSFGASPRIGIEHNFLDSNAFIRLEYAMFLTHFMKVIQRIEANGGLTDYPSTVQNHKLRPIQHALTISFGWRF